MKRTDCGTEAETIANTASERTIYLVACVKKKRTAPAPAKDLYVSTLFRLARRYVEATGQPWFILSAKYYLVDPEQKLCPYNETLKNMRTAQRRAWSERVKEEMKERLPSADRIVVLAGNDYRRFLMFYLEQRAAKVDVPMEGLRIGEQLQWLRHHVAG